MGFDFAVSTDGSNASTTNDDENEASPDFESNETGDLYLTFGDWKNTLGKMLEALDLEPLKIYSDDTLEDSPRLLGEHKDAHPQQLLHMVASLAKSTSGKDQRDNDHAIGLRDGKAPEEHFGDDSFSYALYSKDLPTIQWEGLDGGERENLEEMGIDPAELGFDPTFGGPKLLKVNGERLPIAVEEGDEVMDSLETLQQLPDEPSAWTEDGLRESSDPSVFDGSEETDDSDNGGSNDTSDVSSELASDPSTVSDFNVDEVKKAVTHITSRRTLRQILEAEEKGKDRSVTDRIEQRIRAVEDSSEDDEDDTETESGADDEADDESGETVEDIKHLFGLSDLEADAAQFRVESGKADDLMEAAKQVNDL
jgi:hypothetical protein